MKRNERNMERRFFGVPIEDIGDACVVGLGIVALVIMCAMVGCTTSAGVVAQEATTSGGITIATADDAAGTADAGGDAKSDGSDASKEAFVSMLTCPTNGDPPEATEKVAFSMWYDPWVFEECHVPMMAEWLRRYPGPCKNMDPWCEVTRSCEAQVRAYPRYPTYDPTQTIDPDHKKEMKQFKSFTINGVDVVGKSVIWSPFSGPMVIVSCTVGECVAKGPTDTYSSRDESVITKNGAGFVVKTTAYQQSGSWGGEIKLECQR